MIDLRNFNVNKCLRCSGLPIIEDTASLNGRYTLVHNCVESPALYVEMVEEFASPQDAVMAWNVVNPESNLESQLETAKRIMNAQELRLRELGDDPSEAVAVIGEPVHPAIRERDAWMQAALATRLCRADVDVSTPENYKAAQTFAASELVERNQELLKTLRLLERWRYGDDVICIACGVPSPPEGCQHAADCWLNKALKL